MARLKERQLKKKTFDVEAAHKRAREFADANRPMYEAAIQQAKEQGVSFTGALAGKTNG